jgi:hypothetical protein
LSDALAWAAGLFEGEGFLVERRVGRRVYLQLGIEMTDRDVVERFRDALRNAGIESDAAIARRRRPRPHKDIFRWAPTGAPAVAAFTALRPYLGIRRSARGDAILSRSAAAAAAALAPRQCERCGDTFDVVDYGHSKRFCSAVCRERSKRERPAAREAARERSRRYKARLKERQLRAASLEMRPSSQIDAATSPS